VWDDFWKNLARWLTLSCYAWCGWFVFSLLPYLPVEIADKIVEGFFDYIGF
jgi:hypothetical protein